MRVGLEDDGREHALPSLTGYAEASPRRDPEGWRAELALRFDLRRGRTTLAHSLHQGPLRVQRAFHPEPNGTCHLYVLHPPGGVAGGDQLHIEVQLEPASRVLITTPGAAKLYRSRGAEAQLCQRLRVAERGCLEWFPQETIVFDGALAHTRTHVELDEGARYAGWEIVCLGRPRSHEPFTRGRLQTELTIRRGGRLCYMERGLYEGGDPVLTESWGLHGAPVFGLFVVVHPDVGDDWVEMVRAQLEPAQGLFSLTHLPGLLLGRYLGASTLDARGCFERMFALLRPLYADSAAMKPRIWQT